VRRMLAAGGRIPHKIDGAADCGGADARVLTMPRYNLHVATEASFS
jgi:hypothetical protein